MGALEEAEASGTGAMKGSQLVKAVLEPEVTEAAEVCEEARHEAQGKRPIEGGSRSEGPT